MRARVRRILLNNVALDHARTDTLPHARMLRMRQSMHAKRSELDEFRLWKALELTLLGQPTRRGGSAAPHSMRERAHPLFN